MGHSMDPELEAMASVHAALSKLEAEQQQRVLDWVVQKLGLPLHSKPLLVYGDAGELGGIPEGSTTATGTFVQSVVSSVKEFVLQKRPDNDTERVAVLGYYLTHYRGTPEFKTRDVTMLNREAKQPPISNAARAVQNATYQSKYLTPTSGGKKQLTTRGEALVEALPDRLKVKEVLADQRIAVRKRRKARKG